MKSFKIAVVAAACAVAVSTAAFASSGWEGPYAGLNVGVGFDNGAVTDKDCFSCDSSKFNELIGQVGVTAGYNHLVNTNTLVGLEAEANYGSQDKDGFLALDDGAGAQQRYNSKIDWSFALLARAGVVNGDSLFFVEGGPAIANLEAKSVSLNGANSWDASEWTPGMKAGLGTEWMMGNGLSARAQYNILVLQDQNAEKSPVCGGGDICRDSWTNTQHTVTVGLTKHF